MVKRLVPARIVTITKRNKALHQSKRGLFSTLSWKPLYAGTFKTATDKKIVVLCNKSSKGIQLIFPCKINQILPKLMAMIQQTKYYALIEKQSLPKNY